MQSAIAIKKLISPRWLSLGGSASLIIFLMALLLYVQSQQTIKPDGYTVRAVAVATLAPPPPPPPAMQNTTKDSVANIAISHSGTGAAIELGKLTLSDELTLDDITPPPLSLNKTALLTDNLSLAWSDVFSVDDLDERPRLLTKLNIRYPKTLSNRGIQTTTARLEVLIDTDGQVSLKRILHSSHAEMNPLLAEMIQRTRFTPPKKDGVAVRASFNWPLEFSDN